MPHEYTLDAQQESRPGEDILAAKDSICRIWMADDPEKDTAVWG